jgi:hypothetical protein
VETNVDDEEVQKLVNEVLAEDLEEQAEAEAEAARVQKTLKA